MKAIPKPKKILHQCEFCDRYFRHVFVSKKFCSPMCEYEYEFEAYWEGALTEEYDYMYDDMHDHDTIEF